ncbi:MAG: ribbon-helix-helix protein, CopG family [Deltaproteobacteria bacterium]|nr:ribbon-helix-helix protein, CopG family [Deltaproteobacteria bacterium]MBI4374027.1 ribbon-helix-helix protein, CopG family [Deltaproteobacteria bacterium]
MFRTTIMLPEAFKSKLDREAEREKISFGELVRRALQKYLLIREGAAAHDSFLSSKTIFQDKGEADVSEHHDRYLNKL